MIGIRWNSNTSGTCPTCGQGIVTKTKKLMLFNIIPIPLGAPKVECGCPAGGAAAAQPMPGAAQPMPGAAQPMPAAAQQQQAPQACTQCGGGLEWSAEHSRSFCSPCQKWY